MKHHNPRKLQKLLSLLPKGFYCKWKPFNLRRMHFIRFWLSSTGGAPQRKFATPYGDFCAPVIWPENNRKINTTKEICITIDSPPLKESWKTVQIEQSFSLKTESSKYFRQTLGGYSTLKYLNVPPILISFS